MPHISEKKWEKSYAAIKITFLSYLGLKQRNSIVGICKKKKG